MAFPWVSVLRVSEGRFSPGSGAGCPSSPRAQGWEPARLWGLNLLPVHLVGDPGVPTAVADGVCPPGLASLHACQQVPPFPPRPPPWYRQRLEPAHPAPPPRASLVCVSIDPVVLRRRVPAAGLAGVIVLTQCLTKSGEPTAGPGASGWPRPSCHSLVYVFLRTNKS